MRPPLLLSNPLTIIHPQIHSELISHHNPSPNSFRINLSPSIPKFIPNFNLSWLAASEVGLMDLPLTTAGELGRLENPGLLSSAPAACFWTWGSVILTAVASALAAAAFGILFSKLQLSIRFRRRRTLVRLPSFCSSGEEEKEEDDDASISSCDTGKGDGDETDEMEERDEDEEEEEEERWGDFSFSSFSLADLVQGMGVVKSWDGVGLGFDGSTAEITGATTQLACPDETTDHPRGAVVRFWDGRAEDEAPAATTRSLLGQRVFGVMAREGGQLIRRR